MTLNRWSHEPQFTQGDISVIMLTENLTDVNPRLSSSPSTVKVTIPFPGAMVRTQFLEFLEAKDMLLLERGLNPERIGNMTSGLNLLNLNQLVAESYQEDKPITLEYLRDRKRTIIENEAAGLLELVETGHDLSLVSGIPL